MIDLGFPYGQHLDGHMVCVFPFYSAFVDCESEMYIIVNVYGNIVKLIMVIKLTPAGNS